MKNGFTLIELLVVVLIVGILAAIALPQYQKAVAKSRAAEAVIVLNAMVKAQQRYYMANGAYTTDLSLLDIELPVGKDFAYHAVNTDSSTGTAGSYYRGSAWSSRYQLFFEFAFELDTNGRWCAAKENDANANSICQTYGTYTHSGSGNKYYKM